MLNPVPFNFNKKTPEPVRAVVQELYQNKHRARFFYGDLQTGEAWMEEHDVMGTVGKSTGPQPCPLLINNARSLGGGRIMGSVVKIIDIDTRRVLYEHPSFSNPADRAELVMPSDHPAYVTNVVIDGKIHARFHSDKAAVNWLDFMQGKRFSK